MISLCILIGLSCIKYEYRHCVFTRIETKWPDKIMAIKVVKPTAKVTRIGICRCSVSSSEVESGTCKIGDWLKVGSFAVFKRRGVLFVRKVGGFI